MRNRYTHSIGLYAVDEHDKISITKEIVGNPISMVGMDDFKVLFGENMVSFIVPEYEEYFFQIIKRVFDDYPFASVVVTWRGELTDEIWARLARRMFLGKIKGTHLGYVSALKALEDNLDNLIENAKTSWVKVNSDLSHELDIDAVEDSMSGTNSNVDETDNTNISKFNDTGKAGANPNLLSDTYLTSSTRNESEGATNSTGTFANSQNYGARKNVSRTLGDKLDNYNEYITAHDADSIKNLMNNINAIYGAWAKEISKILTIF